MKYKVLSEVEVLGEVRTVGSELEIDAETAAPLVAEGKLEEVKEETPNTATPAEPQSQPEPTPTAPENTPSAPVAENQGDKPEGWVGGHTMEKPGDK